MSNEGFISWLKNIYNTQAEEISCTECFDLVSRFVELEFSARNPAVEMPQVVQHLHQCPACRQEYETLHDLRQLEEQGIEPSIEDLMDSIH